MNTALITHKLCSSVSKHTLPPPEGASLHDEKRVLQRIKSSRCSLPKRVLHNVVRSWFVRSSDKDGQRFLSTA